MVNKIEQWKAEKHSFDVWDDLVRHAETGTAMKLIDSADLERMKWYGVFYRKRDGQGSYMLRLRVTGGELTAQQAKEIAHVAYEFGYGIVDITTRSNIQIQGLEIENVPVALARLKAVGISCKQSGHDNLRNVFGHPLSGVDPQELIDTGPLCRELSELFLDSRMYSDLPRKFNIALCGRPQASLLYHSQDISLIACRGPDEEVQFHLLLGGKQGQHPQLATHLPILVPPQRVVEVVRVLLDLFREQGTREKRDRARFCYLLNELGVEGLLDYLDDRLVAPLIPCTTAPPLPAGYEDHVGWIAQKQSGLWAMGLCPPLGRLDWQQLEGLAITARRWGGERADGQIRLTPEQSLLIADIPTGFKDAAATAAARFSLSPACDSVVRSVVACTGKQFCNIAVTETKSHALALIGQLRSRSLALHGIRIHMSGCPSACALHHTADIGLKGVRVRRLLGTREGFDVYLGGGVNSQLHFGLPYRMGVDVEQLPQLVQEVVEDFYLRHKPGQTFSAYWRQRLREQAASKTDEAEYRPPIWECDHCGNHYHGDDPPVYCPSCASLRRHFARLEDGSQQAVTETSVAESLSIVPDHLADNGYCFAAEAAEIADGAAKMVEIDGREIALFRQGDTIAAIDNACPHAAAPLSEGTVIDGVVTCPLHDWKFRLCDGCSVDPPGQAVQSYPVQVENGKIYLNPMAPATVG